MCDIYIYNPTGDMALANGTNSYMPPKGLRQFERDLSFLPSFYASNKDIVVMDYLPDTNFLKKWQKLGLPDLNYISINELVSVNSFNSFIPWSWNQVMHNKIKNIKENSSSHFKSSPNFNWNSECRMFFSRNTTNKVQKIISNSKQLSAFVSISNAAINLYSIEEVYNWVKTTPASIFKMPWSSSGRGIHIVDTNNKKLLNKEWVEGALKQQDFITAEPLLNKCLDFSFQLYLKRCGDISFEGISYFNNDLKGHYTGGTINWPLRNNEISTFLTKDKLDLTAELLIKALKEINPEQFYEGNIGIDAIVFLNDDNKLFIHPCLDINWRCNMGLININLNKFVSENAIGNWYVKAFPKGEWNGFIKQKEMENPLKIDDKKITSGFINLTPPNQASVFGVWMEVDR